jgi:hypothetical protein
MMGIRWVYGGYILLPLYIQKRAQAHWFDPKTVARTVSNEYHFMALISIQNISQHRWTAPDGRELQQIESGERLGLLGRKVSSAVCQIKFAFSRSCLGSR